jgi:hypothetical protein
MGNIEDLNLKKSTYNACFLFLSYKSSRKLTNLTGCCISKEYEDTAQIKNNIYA